MAPIVSLAARNLPPTFDAVDLRGFVHESFDYDVHVWPLVNEYADDGSTVLSRSATIAVDIPTPKLGTRENGVNEMIEILNGRKIICRGGEWFSTFDKQFYGIVPLYEHQQGSDVDIFTIHGLGGHAFRSWCGDCQDKPKSARHWARDFLPQTLESSNIRARISSIGYNGQIMDNADKTATIHTLAGALLAVLSPQCSKAPRPFYFICHSLGGLILCQALVLCLYQDPSYSIERPQYRDIFIHDNECMLKGVHFLGTPFQGSLVAEAARPYVNALAKINPYPTNPHLVSALTKNRPDLATIVSKFRSLQIEWGIQIWVGYETKPIGGNLVTDHQSAEGNFGRDAIIAPLTDTTHTSMIKYDSPNQNYEKIARGLVNMVKVKPEEREEARRVALQIDRGVSLENQPNDRGMNQVLESRKRLVAEPAADPKDGTELAKLGRYDTVFVINDTNSMILPVERENGEQSSSSTVEYRDRWSVLEMTMVRIVNTAVSYDPDGVDIRFLRCGEQDFKDNAKFDAKHIQNGQELLDRLELIRSEKLGTKYCQGGTIYLDILQNVLDERLFKFQRWNRQRKQQISAKAPKFLNVVVLTDGMANDVEQVEWVISDTAKGLDECNAPPRCIGVQFVQIGDDEAASEWLDKLDKLDNELGRGKGDDRFRDIVDTKPWNAEKIEDILLGAIGPRD